MERFPKFRPLLLAAARPLRFAMVGAVCGLVQLILFVAFKTLAVDAILANVAAYLGSAQLNFLLSNRVIWRDRWLEGATGRDLLRRWLAFHGSIAGTFVFSQMVFIVARAFLPDILASCLGIGIAALANFVIQDRLTFQHIPNRSLVPTSPPATPRQL